MPTPISLRCLASTLRGLPYYGFNEENGHWIVADASGNELTDAPVKLTTNSYGYTKFEAVKAGHCYLKYVINEDCYSSAQDMTKFAKNSDLSQTAVLEVNVTEPEAEVEAVISGSFIGETWADPVNIEGEGKLDVRFYDKKTRKEVEVPYTWDQQELAVRGIKLESDGMVSFTRAGRFHVCVKSGSYYSDWYEIIVLGNPDYGAGDEDPDSADIPVDMGREYQFQITGSYKNGVVDADKTDGITQQFEGDEGLRVAVVDENGKEWNVKYTWEKQDGEDGIIIADEKYGYVTFLKEGIYHVRVRSGEYVSDWAAISTAGATAEEEPVIQGEDSVKGASGGSCNAGFSALLGILGLALFMKRR